MPFTGRQEQVEKYYPSDDGSGNPFIEALIPGPETRYAIAEYLTVLPIFPQTWLNLPTEHRIARLDILDTFLQPDEHHIELFRNTYNAIRSGYKGRNPLIYRSRMERETQIEQFARGVYDLPLEAVIALSSSLVGISRVGKTWGLRRALEYNPQVLKHSAYNGQVFDFSQLVWLALECPTGGRPNGLCLGFFNGIDNILQTDYYEHEGGNGRASADDMIQHIPTVAAMVGLGLLCIDELQLLAAVLSSRRGSLDSKKDRVTLADELLNVLLSFENTLGVPVVYVGTPPAKKVFARAFRVLARTSRFGSINWNRMNIDSKEWGDFLASLCAYQLVKSPAKQSDINEALYDCCAGITGVAIIAFKDAQRYVLDKGTERLTADDVRKGFEKYHPDWVEVISALRNNRKPKPGTDWEVMWEDLVLQTLMPETELPLPIPPKSNPPSNNPLKPSEIVVSPPKRAGKKGAVEVPSDDHPKLNSAAADEFIG